jgi:hypothetical protein
MPPKRTAKTAKTAKTTAKTAKTANTRTALTQLISDLEETEQYSTQLSIKTAMEIIGKSGVFSRNFKSADKEEFIMAAWKFYSGNQLSYVINKYMYMGSPNNSLVVGSPHYTDEDLFHVYSNLPVFKMYADNLIKSLSKEPLDGELPNKMNFLMELLVGGLMTTVHLKSVRPEFFMTTKEDTVTYRGFRFPSSSIDESILLKPNKSFVSTTEDIEIALQHAKPATAGEQGALVVYSFDPNMTLIRVNKLHTDILLSRMAQQSEKELLFIPGHKFKLLEKGVFKKQKASAVHTFNSKNVRNAVADTYFVKGDDIEIPYYKIHVSSK